MWRTRCRYSAHASGSRRNCVSLCAASALRLVVKPPSMTRAPETISASWPAQPVAPRPSARTGGELGLFPTRANKMS